MFKSGAGSLITGGVAAILASACCVGPLLLGIGGAWVSNLKALEPFRPLFMAVAVVSLVLAYRAIWKAAVCKTDAVCALPAAKRAYKFLFWLVAALIVAALGFPYIAFLFY